MIDELPENLGATTTPEGDILVRKGMEFSDTFRAVTYEMACAEFVSNTGLSRDDAFCAYSTTYLLCKKYGADTQAFDFSNVNDIFNGLEARDVKDSLSQIRDAAEEISGRMEKYLGTVERATAIQAPKNQGAR